MGFLLAQVALIYLWFPSPFAQKVVVSAARRYTYVNIAATICGKLVLGFSHRISGDVPQHTKYGANASRVIGFSAQLFLEGLLQETH